MPAALSIKVRCASWQQLATLYKRDLSRGAMFLKASTPPPIGTQITIDLELPSGTVIALVGAIVAQISDPQRGNGVDLKLAPLPAQSVWVIESALASETKMHAPTTAAASSSGPVANLSEGGEIAEAETELVRALEAEIESLKKLNPFLVLGVGYETTDEAVRQAFGELTKRYHPDRFARYQSPQLRAVAAEIFILIRDAYHKLANPAGRAQAFAGVGKLRQSTTPATAPKQVPPLRGQAAASTRVGPHDAPTNPSAHDRPTPTSAASAQLAQRHIARGEDGAVPVTHADVKSGAVRSVVVPAPKRGPTPPSGAPTTPPGAPSMQPPPSVAEPDFDAGAIDEMLELNRVEDALAAYRAHVRRQPNERAWRAGIELCEGLRALASRDRMEAAQRFEAALEIDPSNERAARELAEMRRLATNERKGLLSRLMGKKES
jgi:DnaJ-domain-containing protein 1